MRSRIVSCTLLSLAAIPLLYSSACAATDDLIGALLLSRDRDFQEAYHAARKDARRRVSNRQASQRPPTAQEMSEQMAQGAGFVEQRSNEDQTARHETAAKEDPEDT